MNGRVYDYNLGRFLSVDPLIHGSGNSQGINPYSYILNNPLSGTDPTGYAPEDEVKKTVTVTKTGSRIKHRVEVSASSNGSGGATVTFSGSNGAAVNSVKNSVSNALSGAGFNVSDIGSQNQIAKSTGETSTGNSSAGSGQSQNSSWFSGAIDEVSNFGDWLANHANDQLSQDESWRGDVWNFFAEDGINAFNELSSGEYAAGIGSIGLALLKPLKATDKLVDSYNNLKKAGRKDAHHIIQDAAARDLPNYSRGNAPSVQLRGPSTSRGSPHYNATQVQRQRGGGTYASERRIGYKALRRGGLSRTDAREAIRQADNHFESLGVNSGTQMRIPGNRR